MGFTWIILLFLQFSGLTTGEHCNQADYGKRNCVSTLVGWNYNRVICSIPEDYALTHKTIYESSSCTNWGQKRYTEKSGSVEVWGGCELMIVFCLKRETTTNAIQPTTTTMTPTSTITTTIPIEADVASNSKTTETIPDVFKSTPRSSYDDITSNSSNKFSNVDLNIHRQKDALAIYVGIAVGGIFLVVLSASILCFLRKRQARAQKKIGIQTGNVENINYMYLSDTREEIYVNVRYINSPVNEIVCIPGEARISVHRQNVVSKSDHGTIGCKDTDDYNRIYFSGKPIVLDPTYNHTASALSETRLYNATENSTSKEPFFLDTEYNHTFVSRGNVNDLNTSSDASENVILDDTMYANLGNI